MLLQESEIQRIYSEIATYTIELEADLTVMGPRYVSKKLALCRNYLNRVAKIRVDLSKHKRMLGIKIAGENTQLQVERDQLISTNELVKKGSNIKDREAIANTMLRERLARIEVLNQDLLDLKMVDAAVEFIHDELIRTSREINTQKALLEIDRYYKTGYGDETEGDTVPRDSKGRPLPQDEVDLEREVEEALAGLKGQEALPEESNLETQAASLVQEANTTSESTPTTTAPESPDVALVEVDSEMLATMAEIDSAATAPANPKSDEPLGDIDLLTFVSGVDILPTAEIKTMAPTETKKKASRKTATPVVTPVPMSNDVDIDFQDLLAGL